MIADWGWLKSLAPGIATAIAGPLGGIAVSFIADKLGVDEKTADAVSKAISGDRLTPDQAMQIKLAEIEFQKFLQENEITLEEIAYKDRQGARDMQAAVRSWVPAVLAIGITVGFFGILGFMFSSEYKPTEALLVMLGALGTAWGAVVNFYFGSSAGSQTKTTLIDKLSSR